MAGDVEVRNISGSCKVGGDTVGVTSLSASFGINSWPSFNMDVALHVTGDGAADTVTADMVHRQLGEWQNAIMGPDGLSVDLDIKVDGKTVAKLDGGKATSASMTLAVGTLRASIGAVPSYAELDNMDLSIYRYASTDIEISDEVLETVDPEKPVNEVIASMADTLMGKADEILSTFEDDEAGQADKKAFQRQHATNQQVIGIFKELMSASSDLGKMWDLSSLIDKGAISYTSAFGNALFSTLTRNNGSFLSTICSIANMFRAIYVPGMTKVGALVPKSVMIAKSDDTKWTTVSLNGNAYGSTQLPIGSVMLVLPEDGSHTDVEVHDGKGHVVVYDNPKNPKYGRTHAITPPPWLPAHVDPPCDVDKDGKAPKRKGASPTDIKGRVSDNIKQARNPKPWNKLLREWCRQELIDQLFGNYITAIVSTTHELSCGKRVRHDMGSGFLCQSSMRIDIGQGTGNIRTVYTCTHSVYDDAVLSGLN